MVHGVDVRLSASLTERICSAFSKEVVPPTLWTPKRRFDTNYVPPTDTDWPEKWPISGTNSKISKAGSVRVSSHARELDASTKTEDLTG